MSSRYADYAYTDSGDERRGDGLAYFLSSDGKQATIYQSVDHALTSGLLKVFTMMENQVHTLMNRIPNMLKGKRRSIPGLGK